MWSKAILSALALSSMYEADMKCEDYPAKIAAEKDPIKRDKLMREQATKCPPEDDVSTNATTDSGGGGHSNPPPPGDGD